MGRMKWQEHEYEPTRAEYELAQVEREASVRGCRGCKTMMDRFDCGCIVAGETPRADAIVAAFERKTG